MIKDIGKWLRTNPKKSEIVEIQNGKDKVKIIPQKIIETLLDELTDHNWSTRNFQFSRWTEQAVPPMNTTDGRPIYNTGISGRTMCDASLELVVTYRQLVIGPLDVNGGPAMIEKEITRTLVGAYSFDVALYGNDYIANTAKSLCIANAASDLGRRFGKDLNPKEASMMILGIKNPLKPGQVTEEAKNKIGETLDKLKGDLIKKIIE